MMKNLMLSLSLYVMTVGLCYDWICLYLCYFSTDLTPQVTSTSVKCYHNGSGFNNLLSR